MASTKKTLGIAGHVLMLEHPAVVTETLRRLVARASRSTQEYSA